MTDDAGPPIALAERAVGFVWLLPPGSALLPPAPISAPASRSEEVFKAGKRGTEENVLLSFHAFSQGLPRLFPLGKAEVPSICQ